LTRDETVELAVQVRGKVRGHITVPLDATDEEVIERAKLLGPVAREIEGKPVRRAIVVKGRLVNLVV
jgi:leucyl-tRNA synthetase